MKDDAFPSITQALLLVVAVFLTEYVIGLALYDSRGILDLTLPQLGAFTTLLGNAVVFAVLMNAKNMTFRGLLHPSRHSIRSITLLIVPPVAMLVPLMLLIGSTIAQLLVSVLPMARWEQQMFERMAAGNLASVLGMCLLAPVLEEMLFRGIILRAFLHQYDRRKAILASALIFGAAHLNIYQFVIAFLLGVLLGWLYERTRSLIPCIALHGLYNTSIWALQASGSADGGGWDNSAGDWGIAVALASAGASLLIRMLKVA
ncbi:MAG TPA: CPBP family intramembrane glutamic endopeptidase [Ramlibacter sp.]|nr:CPBP family intramembrane glutamic endopeptidase [Ramlibacter sp.]